LSKDVTGVDTRLTVGAASIEHDELVKVDDVQREKDAAGVLDVVFFQCHPFLLTIMKF
jgi:hypothetical protein